jgi:hypothetical protein
VCCQEGWGWLGGVSACPRLVRPAALQDALAWAEIVALLPQVVLGLSVLRGWRAVRRQRQHKREQMRLADASHIAALRRRVRWHRVVKVAASGSHHGLLAHLASM